MSPSTVPAHNSETALYVYYLQAHNDQNSKHRHDPRILEAVDADYVVQLGVGAAFCGRACLSLGIPYLGLCMNSVHASWARSCLDHWACEEIVRKGSPLHEQDLAELISTHFSDALQSSRDRDDARDPEDEEEQVLEEGDKS